MLTRSPRKVSIFLRLALLLSLSTITFGQEEAKTDEDERQTEDQKRQRQEMSNKDDVDTTKTEVEAKEPVTGLREDVVEFYGSLRVVTGTEGDNIQAQDNASRFGLFAAKDFAPRYGLFARLELGVNIVESFGRILNPSANAPEGAGKVIPRLGYVGIETPYGDLSFGKQWSAYWPVAVFTDRFAFSGGLANSSFNAGTDGGASGTGRADTALKFANDRGPIDAVFQWQPGNRTIPLSEDAPYDFGIGGSAIYEWNNRLSLGFAFNVARIEVITEELEEIGITGDDRVLLAGVMYRDEPFYFAATVVDQNNHDVDDRQIYINARGVELYARVTLKKRYRVVGGFNYLIPKSDLDGTQYELKFGLLGFQYSLQDQSFWNIIYAEFLLDESTKFDGDGYNNAFLIGIRWTIEI